MYELETERLWLHPIAPDDVSALHTLWTHPDVRRYLFDDNLLSPAEIGEFIETSMTYFEEHGFGIWAIRSKERSDLLGFCGYWFFHDQRELLYGLHPDHWGQGLATECARALIRYGFEQLRFEEVIASTDAPNTASIRVMERLGMRFLKREPTDGLDTIYYHLHRTDSRSGLPI